ncbi:MAG: MATE family efflux transporter [Clostridia bacterium]|nr:MATE family efflux transporter [Clostridia bacterium]
MTEGPLFKKIVSYTLPIIFSGILQLAFNAVDLIVVGFFCGEISLAAVGATGSLINLVINVFIGLSVGGGITVARALGAGKNDEAQKAVHTVMPIALISGLIITAVGVPLSKTLLSLMDTPDSVIGLSTAYMQIYFSGTIFNMLYNFGSAVLRATGDTQRPLVYLAIAGTANVVLNVFFVTVFDMNVAGVALATIISQAISAILILINLTRRTDACRFSFRKMKINLTALKSIIHIGVPSGVASSFFSISNVLIQSSVNSFGDVAMSGAAAAASIEGFVYTSLNSFMHTTQNFVSQNFGAKKFDRIKKTVLISSVTVTVLGIVLGVGAYLLGAPLLKIYIKDSAAAVEYGLIRLSIVSTLYFMCGLMETLSGAIRGLGSSLPPTIVSLIGACAFRVIWILTVFRIPKYHTLEGIYISYPISWMLTITAHAITFIIVYKRKKKQHTQKPINDN